MSTNWKTQVKAAKYDELQAEIASLQNAAANWKKEALLIEAINAKLCAALAYYAIPENSADNGERARRARANEQKGQKP